MYSLNLMHVTTAVVVLTLLAANLSQSINLSEAQTVGAKYCTDHKHKSTDWKDGCNSGLADCRGDKPYDHGKHSSTFIDGYKAGWSNGGCYHP